MKKVFMGVWIVLMSMYCNYVYAEIPDVFHEKLNIVLITEFSTGTHASQYIAGIEKESASLGFHLEIMDARNKRDKMTKMLYNAVLRRVDGILISHGDPDLLLEGVKRAVRNNIPVVAFDCEIPLKEVVKIDQNDYKIAELGLKQIIQDTKGTAKLVHIWVPGYAPMEKRMKTYQKLMPEYPKIEEIERFGEVTNNTALQTQVVMKSLLEKYPKGTIDVVWATWDEFAKGAARAIQEAKRDEIKLYGIDVSNEDLEMLQDSTNPWIVTVGVAPEAIGKVQVRILAYLLAKQAVPERYSLDPVLISRDMLPKDKKVTMETLHEYVQGFGDTTDFLDPWIGELKAKSQ